MKGKRMLLLSVLFVIVLIALSAFPAFAKPKLNKTELTIITGKSVKLKVTGTKKKPTWSSSKKAVVTVSKTGVLTAKKAGEAVIKAKVEGKTLKCKVKVFAASLHADGSATTGIDLLGQESDTDNGGSVVFTFKQEGWYVARLEIQLYHKETQEYSWVYSDSCAIHGKANITVDTKTYSVARVGFQIWYFGWDNYYYNLPYRYTNNAKTFTLSGQGDYPDFKWS